MSQSDLDLTTDKKTGPVECLGQTFESDAARRAHYTQLLREKLKDPEFRKIEGFPIGEDEDILNLSDPPYYTACPNPWIGDFIERYGKPYDPKAKYHREPFAADVSEGKNHPIYKAHSYHTKVPHRAIMRYILHYTDPGDIVFDGFCGTGMTGVAAQLCGDEKEVRELGYRVDADGTIYNEEGKAFSKLGARLAVLNDLSPAATFIASNYNDQVDANAFEKETKRILEEVECEFGWMYETKHTDGTPGSINFVVWSDIFTCPECSDDFVFYDEAVESGGNKVRDVFACPHCSAELTKRKAERKLEQKFDPILNTTVRQVKQTPVLINYSIAGAKGKHEKTPDADDLAILDRIDQTSLPELLPNYQFMLKGEHWGDTWRAGYHSGMTHVHHFYFKRSLIILASLLSKSVESSISSSARFLFQQWATGFSKLNRYSPTHFSQNNRNLSGTLYVGSQLSEVSMRYAFDGKLKRLRKAFDNFRNVQGQSLISTGDSSRFKIEDQSYDYIFLDPPFGSNLMYSELNFLWEAWSRVITNNTQEAIENESQGKTLLEYRLLMTECFREAFRMLKPGRWLTVEFSNTQSSVWNSIQSSLNEVGFVVANVAALDKKQGSYKSVVSSIAVKQDLVISAYKPNGGLEKRFAQNGDSIEGVWDFLQTHLKNLPVVKPKAGSLEYIVERDPRILYDRMVAFYVGHNTPVPLSSGEFQAALSEKYPERDGMVFLHEQVAEYDKKAAQMQHVGQMAIFVEDEKSAINWLRQFLKDRPSVSSDITSEFMQQLSASWKKFESRPELSVLLDQNFIKYDGNGEVPSQIHGYLSTNFKDLRGKDKDNTALKAKAKDRWYVPDPKKAVDVEAVRNKRLFAEFWEYAAQAGISKRKPGDPNQSTLPITEPARKKAKVKKLKEVRTEAIRYGFLECHRNKDAATILAIAGILPNNVIEEDEQLQMIVDMAEMRAG